MYHNQEKASRVAAGLCETCRTTEGTTKALITSNYSWTVQYFPSS